MTEVVVSFGKDGVIKKLQANGHAGFSRKESDIVCSAVTVLIRTAMQILSQTENITFNADSSSRGTLAFCVDIEENLAGPKRAETEARLRCVADFLRTGISSISESYPKNVLLREIQIS